MRSPVFPSSIPRVGLGLAALGRPGYINLGRSRDFLGSAEDETLRSESAMRAQAEAVLDAAWASGVRWFDTARSYGLSEAFVGDWLRSRGIKGADVVVSSKWGYRYTADWRIDTGGAPHEVKDHSVDHFEAQLPETVNRVGDYVRLYQVHSATFESGVLEDAATHAAMRRVRGDRGWRLGLSVSGVAQGATVDAAMTIGEEDPLFDSVQATFNVLDQSAGPALVRARDRGATVVVKEAVANGRALTDARLVAAAADFGSTPDALALACVLAQPFEPFVLSGAVTPDQVASNLAAIPLAKTLRQQPHTLDQLMAQLRQDPETYWQDRANLAWN